MTDDFFFSQKAHGESPPRWLSGRAGGRKERDSLKGKEIKICSEGTRKCRMDGGRVGCSHLEGDDNKWGEDISALK